MDINNWIDKVLGNAERFFANLPIWDGLIRWSKKTSLPGLKGIPIFNIVKFIGEELQKDALVTRANSMAFSFFLAIFPSMIFLITLLPYLPYGADFFETLESSIKEMLPGTSGEWVFDTVNDLLKNQRSGLLSFGFLLALWFSSNGMVSMMNGLSKRYAEVFDRRGMIEQRVTAIKLTFLLTFILFASMVFVILGNTILRFIFGIIKFDLLTRMSLFAFRWVVVLMLFYTGISVIYRYGSSAKKRVPFFNSGATLATLLSVGASWGFSFYADNIGNFNSVYGSIGTIMAFMLWIQINCIILLMGFELNAGIAVIRSINNKIQTSQGSDDTTLG
jgi:membrane protein